MQRVLAARSSNPIATGDGRCEQKNTERMDAKDEKKTATDGTRGPMRKRAVPTAGEKRAVPTAGEKEQEQCQLQAGFQREISRRTSAYRTANT